MVRFFLTLLVVLPLKVVADPPDSLQSGSLSSIPSLYQLAVFNNHLTDSSRFYYPFRNLSDLQALVTPGVGYAGFGPEVKPSFIADGLFPYEQGMEVDGMDVLDPVMGWNHPSSWFVSALSGLHWTDGFSSSAVRSWQPDYSFNAPDLPQTRIFFQQGYDKLSVFEGLFSARVRQNVSLSAGFGRKTFDGPFRTNTTSRATFPGASDQNQYYAQIRWEVDSLTSARFFFMSSSLKNGNYGGIDDSLLAAGTGSTSDPLSMRLLSSGSTARHSNSMLHASITRSDTLFTFPYQASVITGVQNWRFSSYRPSDSSAFSDLETSYQVERLQGHLRLRTTVAQQTIQFQTGVNRLTRIQSSFLPRFLPEITLPASFQISSPDSGVGYVAGLSTGDMANGSDFYRVSGTVFYTSEGHTTGLSGSVSREPVSLLDQSLIHGSITNTLYRQVQMIRGEYRFRGDDLSFLGNAGLIERTNPGAVNTFGRQIPDSAQIFSGVIGTEASLFSGIKAIWFPEPLEINSDFFITNSDYLPGFQTRIELAWHSLFFSDHLYLRTGIEGIFRQQSKAYYPDIRFNQVFYYPGEATPALKQVNFTLRGKVNDIIFWWEWKNLTNEPGFTYQGYPLALSEMTLGLTWWLWN